MQGFTQKALADKANVNISAIRKFEQTGQIGLDSFIKIIYVLDLADTMLASFKNDIQTPKSIDEIIKLQKKVNDSVTKKRRVRKK